MKKKRKIRIKPKFALFLKIIGTILCLLLGVFLFYLKQINDLKRIGYSSKASQNILFSFHKDDILAIGENKTLNAAFESDYFIEDNMNRYTKINYVNHEHFIKNINKLIKIGYSDSDINIIFSHGNDEAVTNFTKRDKIKYLEEFYTIDYAKLDNYDRYVNYSDETGEDEETTVLLVNLDMDKEAYQDSILVSKFSIDMLVNKHRHLSEDFVPDNLVKIDSKYSDQNDLKCSKVALDAYIKMSDEAMKEGIDIVINSAYRSYQDQEDLTELYLNSYGQSYVDKYVAKPGYSEHQTGLGFDIGSRKVNVFLNSKEYTWMQDNAYKYGFILRFPKKWEDFTGFRSEPWHYRYVGKEIAEKIHEENISLEEYWAKYIDKN